MDDNLVIEFEADYRHLAMSNEVEQYLYLKILQILEQNESIKKNRFY